MANPVSRKIAVRTTGHGPSLVEASADVVHGKVTSIALEYGALPANLPAGHFPTAHLTINGLAVLSTKYGGVFVNPVHPDGKPILVAHPKDQIGLDCSVPVQATLLCDT